MARPIQTLSLKSAIMLQLRDGSLVRIAPGPYGKGVAVVPMAPKQSRTVPRGRPRGPTGGPRGRKPRPSTLALREKLEQDRKANRLREPPQYVKWLIDQDDGIGLPMARTVVYRELRKHRTG